LRNNFGNISKSPGILIASPFCKEGLRGIFLIQPGFFEILSKLLFLEVVLTALDGHENQFDFFNVVAKFLE